MLQMSLPSKNIGNFFDENNVLENKILKIHLKIGEKSHFFPPNSTWFRAGS